LKDRLEQLKALLMDSPDEPFLLFALAQEYSKMGDVVNALSGYERLLSVAPGYSGTYYHLGKLYENLGRKEDATRVYKRGMEITRGKNELHAYAELQSALSNITDED
jgi:tetratricopeptide (TPR) repeat protein